MESLEESQVEFKAGAQINDQLSFLTGLPKQAKLLKAADYNHVFDSPVRSSDRYFTILARPNNLLNARLGMAFTKKKVKLSVARNRLKRLSRESFRLYFFTPKNQGKSLVDTCNADFIVLAGPQCVKASNLQLFNSLENHWQQLIKKCEKL